MTSLQHKIDFALIISVKNANPNGDPLDGNRPRVTYEGLGEISDVCLKRKLRDRLQEGGFDIFVQSDDRRNDDFPHLKARAEALLGQSLYDNKEKKKNTEKACAKWFDVRAFGQLFAYENKGKGKKNKDSDEDSSKSGDGVSIPIRGPLTIQSAFSVKPISIASNQIVKSVNNDEKEGKEGKKSSDTMGMKHRVENEAFYVTYGSINPQLAKRTGFSDDDAEAIKAILPKLFENDASSARPEGSMAVLWVFWWKHNCKSGQYSSARVHRSLHVNPDGTYTLDKLDGLKPDELEGF
ncbi:type I-C CRISPR-associated protein Cas7/Csd2 [Oleispirillum naphthae]|uniref:type I-C CRISPR-associated protein Cas7/Csd2 n=1 Tax=Oleispirillum naphthae TaxID=2838853 RepID=UPI0030823037